MGWAATDSTHRKGITDAEAHAEGVSESEITERALTEYFNRRDHAS